MPSESTPEPPEPAPVEVNDVAVAEVEETPRPMILMAAEVDIGVVSVSSGSAEIVMRQGNAAFALVDSGNEGQRAGVGQDEFHVEQIDDSGELIGSQPVEQLVRMLLVRHEILFSPLAGRGLFSATGRSLEERIIFRRTF